MFFGHPILQFLHRSCIFYFPAHKIFFFLELECYYYFFFGSWQMSRRSFSCIVQHPVGKCNPRNTSCEEIALEGYVSIYPPSTVLSPGDVLHIEPLPNWTIHENSYDENLPPSAPPGDKSIGRLLF